MKYLIACLIFSSCLSKNTETSSKTDCKYQITLKDTIPLLNLIGNSKLVAYYRDTENGYEIVKYWINTKNNKGSIPFVHGEVRLGIRKKIKNNIENFQNQIFYTKNLYRRLYKIDNSITNSEIIQGSTCNNVEYLCNYCIRENTFDGNILLIDSTVLANFVISSKSLYDSLILILPKSKILK